MNTMNYKGYAARGVQGDSVSNPLCFPPLPTCF